MSKFLVIITLSEDDDIEMMPWNFSMRKYSKRIFAVFYV